MRAHRTILIAALFAAATCPTFAQNGKPVRKHRVVDESPSDLAVRDAESAIEKNDYDVAEKSLREAISQDGNNYRAWFDLAFVLNAKGQRAQSIEAYRKSIAANPTLFESNLNLGLMLARDGDPEAEKYLRAATMLKPTSHPEQERARAYLALGHVIETSNLNSALEAFKAASLLQPKDATPHLAAAALLESTKQYAAAETEYKRAAELDPKSSDALAGLVNTYQQNGRLADAETTLRQYIALDPQNAVAHAQLGRVLVTLGKSEQAAAELREALKLNPDNAGVARQLADLLADSGKYAEAQALLSPLLKTSPRDADLHYALGRVVARQHDYPAAQNEFITAIKLKGDMVDAYGELAIVANENKNYELALQALEARSKYAPETPATYFLRATIFDHLKAIPQAVANYHLFLQSANGRYPDQEWKAKHRLIALEPKK